MALASSSAGRGRSPPVIDLPELRVHVMRQQQRQQQSGRAARDSEKCCRPISKATTTVAASSSGGSQTIHRSIGRGIVSRHEATGEASSQSRKGGQTGRAPNGKLR
jgi:hypothetical protein